MDEIIEAVRAFLAAEAHYRSESAKGQYDYDPSNLQARDREVVAAFRKSLVDVVDNHIRSIVNAAVESAMNNHEMFHHPEQDDEM